MRLRNIALMSTLCASTVASAQSADRTAGTASLTMEPFIGQIAAADDPTAGAAAADPTAGDPTTGDPTGQPAAGVSVFPLDADDGVSIGQVVFETDNGAETSAWGRIEVDPIRISRALGEAAGFVNVRRGDAWIALNIPVDTQPAHSFPASLRDAEIVDDGGALPVSVYFDLGSTRGRRALDLTAVFSTEPLMHRADFDNLATLPSSRFMVAKIEQTLPNAIDDLAAPGPGPLPPPPVNPSVQLPDPLQGYWAVHLPNPVNIQSARNQCVPIAAANAVKYMAQTFGASRGFSAPHTATRGVRNGGSWSIAEELDERMLRPTTGTCSGNGTGYCPDFNGDSSLYAGLAQYLALWNDEDRLEIHVQGSQDPWCFGAVDVDIWQDGPEVTFDWLCDRIQEGAGITLTYDRFNSTDMWGNEVKTGAHAIRVHACGVMGGRPFIKVLNDTQQDGNVDGMCTLRDGLESQLVYVEDIDNDGQLNYGDNQRWEIVQAMAITIDP